MKIKSVFKNKEHIPSRYSCEGEGINPRIIIENIPDIAMSLALIVHDPDAQIPGGFTHWVVWNIPRTARGVEENSLPEGAVQGKNSANTQEYIGPCPSSGTHRYFFTVYALDTILNDSPALNKKELEEEMHEHIIEKAELIGLYTKEKKEDETSNEKS